MTEWWRLSLDAGGARQTRFFHFIFGHATVVCYTPSTQTGLSLFELRNLKGTSTADLQSLQPTYNPMYYCIYGYIHR